MSGVRCPLCNGGSEVYDTRGNRRRRRCSKCQHRWTTWEVAVPPAGEGQPPEIARPTMRAKSAKWGRNRSEIRTTNPLTRAMLEAIERSGLDDKYVAAKAGIARGQISRFRCGQSTPSFEQAYWILTVLGATFTITDGVETR